MSAIFFTVKLGPLNYLGLKRASIVDKPDDEVLQLQQYPQERLRCHHFFWFWRRTLFATTRVVLPAQLSVRIADLNTVSLAGDD